MMRCGRESLRSPHVGMERACDQTLFKDDYNRDPKIP